ncbi:MAG: hypothetical protein AABX50_01250 [Nanoarchaeota archaeon]
MKIKNKKGELTTKQLVTLIVLIASFIIILFLIFRLNLGQTTDEEICRNSVVLKGQPQFISGPLDCKIAYVTISTEKKEEIMKTLADEMASCWYMFGEGKIDYGSGGVRGAIDTQVDYAICSIIEFDDNVGEKIPQVSYQEFYNFLNIEKKDETQTYLKYLYGIDSLSSLAPQSQIKISLSTDKIFTNQKYSVITGIDNNQLPEGNEILKVYIIPTAETISRLVVDRQFITKA